MHIFIDALSTEDGNRGHVRVLTASLPSQIFWWTLHLIVRSYNVVSASTFFVVDSSLSNVIIQQNYLKIEHSVIICKFMLRIQKLAAKVSFLRRDPYRSISYMHAPFVNILGRSTVQLRHFTATWSNLCDTKSEWIYNTVNLRNRLEFCDNIKCNADSNHDSRYPTIFLSFDPK